MTKRWVIVIGIILLLIISGYLYLRYSVLKAKDFKPNTAKAKNAIDLRPSIVAKLQQLVKDGSNGLYFLSIDSIEPDVLASKVDIANVSINIDTAAMQRLNSLHLLPDDIFKLRFKSLHIDGMGVNDLVNKDRIDINNITVVDPVIDVYHKLRNYNEAERERKERQSLYEKLKGQMKYIAIGNIDIKHATFVNHDIQKDKVTKYKDVSILVNNLLIDSTTQHDNSRFLFAKHVTLNAKNYSVPTSDSLYFFKVENISVSGDQHTLNAKNVELTPRYTRSQFEKRLKYNKEMYHLTIPTLTMSGVNWWSIVNNERLIAREAVISGGSFSIFLDRSIPPSPAIKIANYPDQLLMSLPFPIAITKLNIRRFNLSYSEFSPKSKQNGTAYFDNINAQANYISNMPEEISKHRFLNFSGSSSFMHHVPMTASFNLDLKNYRTGEFTAAVHMNTLDSMTINPLAQSLGLFRIKRGLMQEATAHVQGNNYSAKGNIAIRYEDLHITPVKADKADSGKLKNKTFTSFFANKIFIKDKNPENGKELRQPEYTVDRDHHKNFFNMIWVTIFTGLLKTIGVPVKFAIK